MRADFVEHGFDLFLYDTGGYYQALVGAALGDNMVLATGNLFEPVDAAEIDDYKRRSRNKRRAFQVEVEIRDLPEIFEMEYQSEIWNELGEKCLSCSRREPCGTVRICEAQRAKDHSPRREPCGTVRWRNQAPERGERLIVVADANAAFLPAAMEEKRFSRAQLADRLRTFAPGGVA
jgi:hypothetical protein